MELGKIKGQVVSTVRSPTLPACSLLLVELCGPDGSPSGNVQVAADYLGAGEGEMVLLTRGSSARQGLPDSAPVDLRVVGIVDSVTRAGTALYRK